MQVEGNRQLGLHFEKRSSSLAQKVPKFAGGKPPLALRDIGCNGNCRPTELVREAILL